MGIRKLTLVLALLVTVPLVGTGSAVATGGSCPIGYTGPDSDNRCVSKTIYSCEVSNNNVIKVDGENAQGSISGSTSDTGTTQSGSVQTGSATNSNNQTFNITITSGGLCQAVQTVAPTTPTTPTTTTKTPTTSPVASPTPTKLANTSGDNTGFLVVAGLSVAGLTALAIKFGLPLAKYLRR